MFLLGASFKASIHISKHNMKFRFLIIYFCILFLPNINAQENPIRFKVLSYNLRFGELASLEELADFIKKEAPDMVALQEVDVRTYRERAPKQNGKDFITELGHLTGMFSAYGKTIMYKGGYYGIGILSKYPLASVNRIYLPKTVHGKEQRALLVTNVEYAEKEYITFACTHLDYTNTTERQIQVDNINEILCKNPYPMILSGDFNARPDANEIKVGMIDWKRLCNMDATVPAKNPRYKIDYIFGMPKDNWMIVENRTYSILLSDHLPISTIVELKK